MSDYKVLYKLKGTNPPLPGMGGELAGCTGEETERQVTWSDLLQMTPGEARIVGTQQTGLARPCANDAFVVGLL